MDGLPESRDVRSPWGFFKLRSLRSSAGVSPQELESFFIPNFRVETLLVWWRGSAPP